MKFGYVREWEEEQGQSSARSRLLEQVGDDRFLFSDVRNRQHDSSNYLFMRNMLRAGDVLFLDGLDSLGCTLEDITAEWKSLTGQMQVDVVVLDEEIQLDSRVYRGMGEAGAQLEQQMFNMLLYADVLRQRREQEHLRGGGVFSQQNGRKMGRPALKIDWELFHETARRWADGEIDVDEACELTGSARSSWYKYTRDMGYLRNNKRTVKK